MKRILLCGLALLAALVMLAACGREEGDAQPDAAPTPTLEPTPVPTPTLPPYEPNILTGEPRDADYAVDQRPIAVMINNLTAARPQRGLSQADILVEIKVEGGITRLMPIFQNYKTIGELGPVRSARDQYFQLILPWQMLYYHAGQSTMMDYYSRDYQYGKPSTNYISGYLNCKDADASIRYGHRDRSRVNWAGVHPDYEHTLYTSAQEIQNYIDDENVDMTRVYNSTFFNFVDYRQENPVRDLAASLDSAYTTKYGPVVSDGEYVELSHSQSYRTRFFYDAASNQYKMQQYYPKGSPRWRDTLDEANGNVQLSFDNVLVLFTEIYTYPQYRNNDYDLQYVEYGTGGAAYYCYGGKCERVFWKKGAPLQALQLFYLNEDGSCSDIPLEINIGKTYLAVVGLDYYDNFAHLPLSEVDASNSYGGTVSGPSASEVEIEDQVKEPPVATDAPVQTDPEPPVQDAPQNTDPTPEPPADPVQDPAVTDPVTDPVPEPEPDPIPPAAEDDEPAVG